MNKREENHKCKCFQTGALHDTITQLTSCMLCGVYKNLLVIGLGLPGPNAVVDDNMVRGKDLKESEELQAKGPISWLCSSSSSTDLK